MYTGRKIEYEDLPHDINFFPQKVKWDLPLLHFIQLLLIGRKFDDLTVQNEGDLRDLQRGGEAVFG